MAETRTDWFFIINPHAGSGKTLSEWASAVRKLDSGRVEYTTVLTDHRFHATALAWRAADEGYRKIVAVGGDGSVHEVFNGILRWCDEKGCDPFEFTIGVIPIGSGNDWIKSLGVPHDMNKVIALISEGTNAGEDVVKVTGASGKVCWMANIGGAGFDSHVCERVNRQKERGRRSRMIYFNALRHTLFAAKPICVSVVADGEIVYSGPVYSIGIGNGMYSGGGMVQVPMARMDDGIVDAMIVPKMKISQLIKEIPRLYNKSLEDSDKIIFAHGKVIEIIPLDAASVDIFEIDGEVEGTLPVRIEATGQKIKVVKD